MSSSPGTLHEALESRGIPFVSWLGSPRPARFESAEAEDRAATETVALLDRSYRATLELRGEKLFEFLDGIVSQPVAALADGEGTAALFLSARGKILAHFRLLRLEAGRAWWLLAEPGRDELLRALQRYAFLGDVEVVDRSAERVRLSLEGPRAQEALRLVTGQEISPSSPVDWIPLEIEGLDCLVGEEAGALRGGLEILAPAEGATALWSRLEEVVRSLGGCPAGAETAERLRVEAGTGIFGIDYDDGHFPADARLEGDLDYSKCYVGQEVVARMRTYGQPNRRLVRLRVIAGDRPAAGAKLLAAVDDRPAGVITSVADSRREGPIGLSMLPRRCAAADTELRGETGNLRVKVVDSSNSSPD